MRSAGARRRSGAYGHILDPERPPPIVEFVGRQPTKSTLAKIAAMTHGRDAPGEIEGAPGPTTHRQPERPPPTLDGLPAEVGRARP